MARKLSRQSTKAAVNADGNTPEEQAAYDQGYEEGEAAGYDQGYEAGQEAEREDDEPETEDEDITEEALYQQGHAAGYSAGYDDGYAAAQDQGLQGVLIDEEEDHPLRRIVAVSTTSWTHSAWETHRAQRSCGHVDGDVRTEAAILKDVAKRRRIVCTECHSDV